MNVVQTKIRMVGGECVGGLSGGGAERARAHCQGHPPDWLHTSQCALHLLKFNHSQNNKFRL